MSILPRRSQTSGSQSSMAPGPMSHSLLSEVLLPSNQHCKHLYSSCVECPHLVVRPGAEHLIRDCANVTHVNPHGGAAVSASPNQGHLVLTELRLIFLPNADSQTQTQDVSCSPSCVVQLELAGIADISASPTACAMEQCSKPLPEMSFTILEDVQERPESDVRFATGVPDLGQPSTFHAAPSQARSEPGAAPGSRSQKTITHYGISVQMCGEQWVTWQRFSKFLELHSALAKRFGHRNLPMPPPRFSLLGLNTRPTERRVKLGQYLRDVCQIPGVLAAPCFLHFFGVSEHLLGLAQEESLQSSQAVEPPRARLSWMGITEQHGNSAPDETTSATLKIKMLNGESLSFCVCRQDALGWCQTVSEEAHQFVEQLHQNNSYAAHFLHVENSTLEDSDSQLFAKFAMRKEYLRLGVRSDVGDRRRVASDSAKLFQELGQLLHGAEVDGPKARSVSNPTFSCSTLSCQNDGSLIDGTWERSSSSWRLSTCNKNYSLADSYPSVLACPTVASDQLLRDASEVRARCRIPVLTWRHPIHGAPLCRSSEPSSGYLSHEPTPDHELLRLIRETAPTVRGEKVLQIVDARSRFSAAARVVRGGGSQHYSDYLGSVRVHFLNIDNVNEMHSSLEKLSVACVSNGGNFLRQLADSQWLDHQARILSGAHLVATILEKGHAVLVHCSDGWDRTSQLVSLAQLLLDPYYRTLQGFSDLIEKDWCAFGHNFQKCCTKGRPIFMQWLECVWQLTQQYPNSFEFDDDFLVLLSDAVYSRWFQTFMGNCESERKTFGDPSSHGGSCFWRYAEHYIQNKLLRRQLYSQSSRPVELLDPITSTHALRLWPIHQRNILGMQVLQARQREYSRLLLANVYSNNIKENGDAVGKVPSKASSELESEKETEEEEEEEEQNDEANETGTDDREADTKMIKGNGDDPCIASPQRDC